MRKNIVISTFLIFGLLFFMQSCTEPFVPKTETFEDLLVVEATITNEMKKQKIKLTRTYKFEESGPAPETGAEVVVLDNTGNQYIFEYNQQDGMYVSVSEFQAVPGKEYTLQITTSNGQSYTSTPEPLPTVNQVSLNTVVKEKDGVYGAQISTNSYDPNNSSHYYRYEYSETYKVIVPFWGPKKAILVDNPTSFYDDVVAVPREGETRICYKTVLSDEIILTNTTELSEDRVSEFPIRFLSVENYALTHKYSILVKQYTESYEAYIFYRTLKKVAGSEGTPLSPNQPGFVAGNISVQGAPNKKVFGYFDVASVSSERIFLTHETLFPGSSAPPYFTECEIYRLNENLLPPAMPPEGVWLRNWIKNGTMMLYNHNPVEPNIFVMVFPECTDCTTFASNEIPEFWE